MPDDDTKTTAWDASLQAERYDVDGNRSFYKAAALRLLQLAEPLSGRGLDLGCGTGFSLEGLMAKAPGVAWVGTDASAAMLCRARLRAARVPLVRGHAERLPFAERIFDVVLANFSWHWFGPQAMAEIVRVLRPGGSFLATAPLRKHSSVSGNRALAAALMSDRARYVRRPSQGFRLEAIPAALSPAMRVVRLEAHAVVERFPDGATLRAVLASRGALTAIFGDQPPAVIATPSPVDFEWPFALVYARRAA